MRFLLDTCTFLWMSVDASELSSEARRILSDPLSALFLSPVSAWEISVKYGSGRLPLPMAPGAFIPYYRSSHRIQTLPFDEASCLYEGAPPRIHKDPFDRRLISRAIAHGFTILTPDPLI